MDNYFIKQKSLKAPSEHDASRCVTTLCHISQYLIPWHHHHHHLPQDHRYQSVPAMCSSVADSAYQTHWFFSVITKTLMRSTSLLPFLQKLGQELTLLTMLSHSCISQTMLWLITQKQITQRPQRVTTPEAHQLLVGCSSPVDPLPALFLLDSNMEKQPLLVSRQRPSCSEAPSLPLRVPGLNPIQPWASLSSTSTSWVG